MPPPSNFRKSFSARFRRYRPLVLVLLFVLSLLMSWAGYHLQLRSLPEAEGGGPLNPDLVGSFRAISHFTLNSLDAEFPTAPPALFLVAGGRWLAVAFVVLSTASLLQSVFQFNDRLYRWWHSRGDGGHSVVIGLGWKGRNLIARQSHPQPCFVIEIDATSQTASAAWDEGASLVHGDGTEAVALQEVRPSKASAIYVCTGSDETNMQVIQELSQFQLPPTTIVCVDLQSQRGFDVLKKSIPPDTIAGLRLFNTEAITTRLLLERHPMDRFDDDDSVRGAEIILLGEGSMARELLRQVMQHGIFEPGKKLVVTWLVDDPQKACAGFAGHYPCFTATLSPAGWRAMPPEVWDYEGGAKVLPEVRFLELPASGRGILELFEGSSFLQPGRWATSVYVVFDDAARSAALATLIMPGLNPLATSRNLKLHLYFNTRESRHREQIQHTLQQEYPRLPLVAFSDFLGDCSMETVRGDALDQTARRVNGIYQMQRFQEWLTDPKRKETHPEIEIGSEAVDLEQLIEQARTPAVPHPLLEGFDDFCLEMWPGCAETDKESNRQAAAHAGIKKRIRTRLSTTDSSSVTQTLAEIEHRRWSAEYLLRGFRPLTRIPSEAPSGTTFTTSAEELEDIHCWFGTDGRKKNKATQKSIRRHVDLVPFEDFRSLFPPDLALEEEVKDHDQIHALDLILRP